MTNAYEVKRLRKKVAMKITTREIDYDMTYAALVDMHLFENWDEEDFYYRPIYEEEIAEEVWQYYNEKDDDNQYLPREIRW